MFQRIIPTLNDDGAHVGGIVGFLRSIGYAIRTIRPTRTILVFDGKGGSNRRRKLFPEYKANRNMSERLIDLMISILKKMNINL